MKVQVAGLTLQNHIMNAAYIGSKTAEDLDVLINARGGAVVVGSITVKPRVKNPGSGYWRHEQGLYSFNSYGMPNGGLPYFRRVLPRIVKAAHAHHKPVIVNVAGFSKEEYGQLITLAYNSGADMAELNLGCPNVWSHGLQKRITSYHPALVEELLNHIKISGLAMKLAVKISPLPPDTLREVAKVIAGSGIVDVVVATNSYPNACICTQTKLKGEVNLAGMTGRALKPISLGVVTQLKEVLPGEIDVIGCGGVFSRDDVHDYLSAGAKAVQIATALVDEGPDIFDALVSPAIDEDREPSGDV